MGNMKKYDKRIWGEYTVLDYTEFSENEKALTKHIVIEAGKNVSYQRHEHRREIWTVIQGVGEVVLDGEKRKMQKGDVIFVAQGVKHTVKAISELHFIEVQMGDELSEEDIERFEYNWEA